MKRLSAIIMAVVIVLSMCVIAASAAEGNSAEVYVTVIDKDGKIAVAAEKLAVTDSDSDGALTISDALYAAHESFYEGGAAAGYSTSVTQYGLGIEKLWGTANGGSYGYYVNNASAWALTDPVKDGDYVSAFVYTDPVGWSDNYSYFDSFMGDVKADEELSLTYYQAGYDANWNPVTIPVEGAEITVDGEATGVKTDAEGKAKISLTKNGKHIVSATIDSKNLSTPVYIATVTGGVDPTEAPTEAATQPKTVNTNVVKTGESGAVYTVLAAMIFAFSVIAFVSFKKKKNEN